MRPGLALTLSALADDTRRTAVEELARQPLSAGELAGRLDVTPAALTRHLRLLRQAGLVSVALDPADSRRHVYSVETAPLEGLTEWAGQLARFWTSQLTAYATEASRHDADW
jgi:DNA-binding transcriptional ArsR family regulator